MKKHSLLIIAVIPLLFLILSSAQAQTTYDADLDSVYRVNGEYTMTPLHHCDTFKFGGRVVSNGTGTITDVLVNITNGSGYVDSLNFSSISAGAADNSLSATGFLPSAIGDYTVNLSTSISETETNLSNNNDSLEFEVTDTIFARDFGNASGGGAGFAGAANNAVGCKFKLKEADTITSIKFYMATATVGDSVKASVYYYNNGPGSFIESAQTTIISSSVGWYTAPLLCPAIVNAGEYFVAIEQLNTSNMGLGVYNENFFDSSVYYGPNGNWLLIESIPFLVSPMIRLNVGPYDTYREVNITSSKDTVCELSQVLLSADEGNTFAWSPASLALSPTTKSTFFELTTATEIIVLAEFGCGLTARDTITIQVTPAPSGTIIGDTSVCRGDSIDLTASGGSNYRWVGGPTNTAWRVSPTTGPRNYTVIIDSTNGCLNGFTTQLSISSPTVAAFGDTAACIGQPVTVKSNGATSYSWNGGPATQEYTFEVTQTEYKVVTGTNDKGCTISDSVLITADISPILTPLKDTGACFTKFITITAGAVADSFLWSNGDTSKATRFQMLAPKTLTVIAKNANGCESYDTLSVARYLTPNGVISPASDTAICEGTSLAVTASGGASYEWSNGENTATANLSPTQVTTYTVITRSAEGCEDFDDITVSVNPLPVAGFSHKVFKDSVIFNNTSMLATSYAWDFGDGQSSDDLNPFNIYDTTGLYTITLTATNDCGDADSTITISVTVPVEINNISDLALWKNVNLYPNPTASTLNYRIENQLYGEVNITIIDVNGKVLQTSSQTKGSNQISGTLDLASYTDGIYLIEFRIDDSVIRSRVVKH
jgi:PKD repeat protein